MGKILMHPHLYAPVKFFELAQGVPLSDTLRGIASPSVGAKPCALALVAGENTVATASAINFSAEAQHKGIRWGWCGFEIGGLGQAVAAGHDVELRCLVSGQVQARWDGASLAAGLHLSCRKSFSVREMLKQSRADGACTDLAQALPFGLALLRKEGSRPFLQATFRYLLNRLPTEKEEIRYERDYSTLDRILSCWNDIIDNEEEKPGTQRVLHPGPFDPSFPFPLDGFDDY